jgi:hypothetical protein
MNNIPAWLKKMPSDIEIETPAEIKIPVATMRRCPAIFEMFKNSYTITSQQDIMIKPDDGNALYHTPNFDFDAISVFDKSQMVGYNVCHAKINTSWVLAEKSGVDFMIIDDYWNNYEQPWRVVPGIVEFKYQNELNVNISSAPTLDQYMIKSSQPIAMLYPVSDKKVVINHHLITEDEWNMRKSSSYRHSYIGNYVKNKMKNTG